MHVVIWGEGLSPVFVAQWLRKLSSTVDITILSYKDRLGYSMNLLPLYAMRKISLKELIPIPLKYIKNVLRANVLFKGYKINLSKRVLSLENEERQFDFLVLALNLEPFIPTHLHTEKVKCPWSFDDVKKIRNSIDDISKVALVGDLLISVALHNLLKELGYESRIIVDSYSVCYLDDDLYRLILNIIGENMVSKDFSELKRVDLTLCSGYWRLPPLLAKVKLRIGKFGVMINESCLSSNDFIYVVGGCAEHIFSHGVRYIALSEGLHEIESLVTATNILGLRRSLKLKRILGSLCCDYNGYIILTLGSTIKEAELASISPTSVRLRGRKAMDNVIVKVVVDKRSMNVIGIHAISPQDIGPILASYAHLIGYLGLSITDLIATASPSSLSSIVLMDPLSEALRSSWYKLLWQS